MNLEVRLFIIGENMFANSGYEGYLYSLIKDLGLQKHVSLVGFTSNPYPYMKHADFFVLSSIKEGFPNVVLEALSLNVPCVVTNCVNFEDIILPDSNGYIVEKANVDALVDGIIKAKGINFQMEGIQNFDYNQWFLKQLELSD